MGCELNRASNHKEYAVRNTVAVSVEGATNILIRAWAQYNIDATIN